MIGVGMSLLRKGGGATAAPPSSVSPNSPPFAFAADVWNEQQQQQQQQRRRQTRRDREALVVDPNTRFECLKGSINGGGGSNDGETASIPEDRYRRQGNGGT